MIIQKNRRTADEVVKRFLVLTEDKSIESKRKKKKKKKMLSNQNILSKNRHLKTALFVLITKHRFQLTL